MDKVGIVRSSGKGKSGTLIDVWTETRHNIIDCKDKAEDSKGFSAFLFFAMAGIKFVSL